MTMWQDLEKLTYKLNEMKMSKSSSDVVISNFISKIIKKNKKIPSANQLSKNLYVSKSSISRFVKKIKFENYNTLRYIVNNFDNIDKTYKLNYQNYVKKTARLILAKKNIYLWGVMDSSNICRDFHTKLLRGGKVSIYSTDSKNQVGFSKLATTKDLLIIISISAKHRLFKKHIKNVKATKILVSTVENKRNTLYRYADIFLKIPGKHLFTESRIVSLKEKRDAYLILDSVVEELLKNKRFFNNTMKTLKWDF